MSTLLVLAIAVLLLNHWMCMPLTDAQEQSRSRLPAIFSAGAIALTAPLVWIIAKSWLTSPTLAPLSAIAAVLLLGVGVQLALQFALHRIELSEQEASVLRQRTLVNCSVFALTLLHSTLLTEPVRVVMFGIAVGVGFEFALYVFREQQARIARMPVPAPFRGAPLTLISAGLMALALMGLQGLWQ
jgi:electron transport complex protein RnfA